MEHVDKVANRMMIAAIAGFGAGAAMALYKGRPMLRMSVNVGCSWALVGTALFGMERIADVSARQLLSLPKTTIVSAQSRNDEMLRYATYSIGGTTGGALVGYIFHQRILPGVVFFTPIMLCLAFAEQRYLTARSKRMDEKPEDSTNA